MAIANLISTAKETPINCQYLVFPRVCARMNHISKYTVSVTCIGVNSGG